MGYDGMLYLLFLCEVICDSVEYMVNVYCVDVMVCISNCDKIIFGMLNVVMWLNILLVFVLGGLMEVGKVVLNGKIYVLDLVDVMVVVVDDSVFDEDVKVIECLVCLICGLCLGMFIVNLMNCLIEVLGLLLLGNGLIFVIYVDCKWLFIEVGYLIVDIICRYYEQDDMLVLLCNVVNKKVFENVMLLDIVMGGFMNIVLYIFVVVYEGGIDFDLIDIDKLLCNVFCLFKVVFVKQDVYMEDVYCVGGIMVIFGQLECGGLIYCDMFIVYVLMLGDVIDRWDILCMDSEIVYNFFCVVFGGILMQIVFSQDVWWEMLDLDRQNGVICLVNLFFIVDGGLVVLKGNIVLDGCIVKMVGVDELILKFIGFVVVYESQDVVVSGILGNKVKVGDVVVICYEGLKGGLGM